MRLFLSTFPTRCSKAFSLLEMAIVVVIIGVIVGGIMVGVSLVHAGQMHAIIKEKGEFEAAFASFRERYDGLPGDLYNATTHWPQTINGNGDHSILWGQETFSAWQELGLSQLIRGNFSGTLGPARPGIDFPKSAAASAGWGVFYGRLDTMCAPTIYTGPGVNAMHHVFTFGTAVPASNPSWAWGRAISTSDALSIDNKTDDGRPGTGNIFGICPADCAGGVTNVLTATYNTANASDRVCTMIFQSAMIP